MIESCIVDRASVALRTPIKIAPGQENLELHYTGLSFIKSAYVRFKYQLVGLDQDWVDVGSRRVAYFNHLPPGQYTFRVIAANSDGVWNTEGASLPITVIPHFWQTWWFRMLALLVLAGMIGLTFWWRIMQLSRKHAAQEAFSQQLIESQESERKRIAAELHDSLGQSLVIIKNSSIRAVISGQNYTSPSVTTYLFKRAGRSSSALPKMPSLDDLTPTERRILSLIAEYKTSKEIADELCIHYRTVENYRTSICAKLDLHGSHALIKFALKHQFRRFSPAH